jgi:hypothetical protein
MDPDAVRLSQSLCATCYLLVIPVLQPRLQMYRGIQYIKYTPKRYYNIIGSNRLFFVVSGARFATEVAKCVAKITCFLQLCNSLVTYPTRQLHKTQNTTRQP